MAQNQSPFVGNSLVPEGLQGGGGVYQLTADSVSPTITTFDANGMPVEETVPHSYWEWWIGLSGCAKRVPMRSAPIFMRDHDSERYQMQLTRDHIRAGQLPAWVCPYTMDYKSVKGGALAPVPAGESDCGGSGEAYRGGVGPTGPSAVKVCSHMQKIMDQRRVASQAAHDKNQQDVERMSSRQVEQLTAGIGAAFGQALAHHSAITTSADPKAARAAMRSGKGEE